MFVGLEHQTQNEINVKLQRTFTLPMTHGLFTLYSQHNSRSNYGDWAHRGPMWAYDCSFPCSGVPQQCSEGVLPPAPATKTPSLLCLGLETRILHFSSQSLADWATAALTSQLILCLYSRVAITTTFHVAANHCSLFVNELTKLVNNRFCWLHVDRMLKKASLVSWDSPSFFNCSFLMSPGSICDWWKPDLLGWRLRVTRWPPSHQHPAAAAAGLPVLWAELTAWPETRDRNNSSRKPLPSLC